MTTTMLHAIKNVDGAVLWEGNIPNDTPKEFHIRAALIAAVAEGANLQYAKLQGADLRYAKLQGANLQGADLQGANLQGADLIYAQNGALQIIGGKYTVLVWENYAQIGCKKFSREELLAANVVASNVGISHEFVAFTPMILAAMDALKVFAELTESPLAIGEGSDGQSARNGLSSLGREGDGNFSD